MSATIFLSGGIIGTCHHLYFSGTPTVALAWGSVFSALEVVPLVLVAFDATDDLRRSKTSPWVQRYKWPIYFFVAVAFWNMVGAGLFGFMINPPIALYYMQGLNTTPLHGHAALFGVYGMLGIGLMLMCLRVLIPGRQWKDGLLRFSFWALNGGLLAMCVLSLLPVGLMQTWATRRTRLLVRTQQRVHADASRANPAVDAGARRHRILCRSRGAGRFRRWSQDRKLIPGGRVMAIPHAQPGQVFEVQPAGASGAETKTVTLIKTNDVEVVRLVLARGKVIAQHRAPGEITVQCLEGRVELTAMGRQQELAAGQMLFLSAGAPHSVLALDDSTVLLTILLPKKESGA